MLRAANFAGARAGRVRTLMGEGDNSIGVDGGCDFSSIAEDESDASDFFFFSFGGGGDFSSEEGRDAIFFFFPFSFGGGNSPSVAVGREASAFFLSRNERDASIEGVEGDDACVFFFFGGMVDRMFENNSVKRQIN